jgi:GTP cyclohydrolase II
LSKFLFLKPYSLFAQPILTTPDPLIEVDRAISELRRGAIVRVHDGDNSLLMLAAEALTPEHLGQLTHFGRSAPRLVMTGTRANVLGIDKADRLACVVTHPQGLKLAAIEFLANPLAALMQRPDLSGLVLNDADTIASACVTLSKLSRLLPAALMVEGVGTQDILSVKASLIQDYMQNAAKALTLVSQARVPLENAENAHVVAFRPRDGGIEHLAIMIGDVDTTRPVLVRLHSECFTGDLIGSLRCDCGNQLRGAIAEMSKVGSGILLYLAQEGRGIGLVNKLRAYQLQDSGFDTVDANLHLGFDSDERNYLPAAQMLRLLGVSRIRLMTNNPTKVAALAKHDIEVVERVPHIYPSNEHNDGYLRTKAAKSGHMFEF